jgi:hypothetical protein
MPAVNFKRQFAERVLRGAKRTTVRPGVRFKVGDRFYGYYGMRTKQVLKLVEGKVIAADVIEVVRGAVTVAGRMLTLGEAHALAVGDGFSGLVEFCAFFAKQYGLPFAGQLVQWDPDPGSEREIKKRLKQLWRAVAKQKPGGKRG